MSSKYREDIQMQELEDTINDGFLKIRQVISLFHLFFKSDSQKINFWPTYPESISKQFFVTGSLIKKNHIRVSRPYIYPTIFVQFWLPHLGGGAWVIETHVIMFHENQEVRCQKSFYNMFEI